MIALCEVETEEREQKVVSFRKFLVPLFNVFYKARKRTAAFLYDHPHRSTFAQVATQVISIVWVVGAVIAFTFINIQQAQTGVFGLNAVCSATIWVLLDLAAMFGVAYVLVKLAEVDIWCSDAGFYQSAGWTAAEWDANWRRLIKGTVN